MDIEPATKFLGNSHTKQLFHMTSELWEVWKAWVVYKFNPSRTNRWKLTSEIIDLQSSGQTMMKGPMGLCDGYISGCREYVIYKNKNRGYYEVPK